MDEIFVNTKHAQTHSSNLVYEFWHLFPSWGYIIIIYKGRGRSLMHVGRNGLLSSPGVASLLLLCFLSEWGTCLAVCVVCTLARGTRDIPTRSASVGTRTQHTAEGEGHRPQAAL